MTALPPRLGAGSGPRPEHPAPSAAGILHLGLGNFHRAHQAVYTSAALSADGDEWGIVGVASRSRAVVDAMRAQDLRYTVAEISPAGASFSVPAVHTDVFVAAEDPERVVGTLADDRIRVVTLTVTEHGYSASPSTGLLDLNDPLIAADLRGGAPQTTIGQLARGLQRRASGSGAPITILSCDNLSENGARTEALVRAFLSELRGTEGAEALAYLDSAVAFPSSMVDRIVPATTPRLRELVAARLGVQDDAPVSAEPFTMWAIEDRFAAARPAWEAGGAVFTDEVGAYEQMKVRLLNGTHSLIAYLGALRGVATISESIADTAVESAALAILRDEYEPSVRFPSGVDVRTYEGQLFERWANHALGHRTAQVGTDGSVKLRQRIPEPALRLLEAGSVPHLIALTVAAYLSCIAPMPGFDPGPHARAMVDPAREELARLAGTSTDGRHLAHRVIAELHLFGQDLAEQPTFISRVGELIDTIRRHGVDAAIRDSIAASQAPMTRTGANR
ncbi:fructuronate reductase [Plantibacter flavus]|uniref:mannitol dehydrogenase family protein n=1 Tax=Plantibacter flavus TaxID=150123 RepID=UPI0010C1F18E|nr:mannitol dehydrogenase family protein [Plantibacter flavus]TKJ99870.1 fructuronate reductase [Plantibacter flavus]